MPKPPITATLTWQRDLAFRASTPGHQIILDGDSAAGPSPVELLAIAVAGCMAIDVADIVTKGRHPLASLETTLVGERREEPPRRFTRIALGFKVGGSVPEHAVQRAIDLSREKYCSVWHSLRQDIELETRFEVTPGPIDPARG